MTEQLTISRLGHLGDGNVHYNVSAPEGAAPAAFSKDPAAINLIVHDSVYDDLLARLKKVYASVKVGDPLSPGTLVGPLIGAAFLVALPEVLRGWVELQRVIYGVILIVVMLYLPGGLVMIGQRTMELLPSRKERQP